VISAAALCPHPPLLLRELGGLQDPAAELREAALDAVASVTADVDRVVVVGGAGSAGRFPADTPVDVRGFGTTGARASSGLPLSLGVGSRLLHDAGWHGPVDLVATAWDTGDDDVAVLAEELAAGDDAVALLALGEGSTRRGEKAPGYLDDRAFPFDDGIAAALATGDAAALRDLDVELADELLVQGATALRVLGAVVLAQRSSVRATLLYRDDPFGVSYFVATWLLHP